MNIANYKRKDPDDGLCFWNRHKMSVYQSSKRIEHNLKQNVISTDMSKENYGEILKLMYFPKVKPFYGV
jgi:hypothetical protein